MTSGIFRDMPKDQADELRKIPLTGGKDSAQTSFGPVQRHHYHPALSLALLLPHLLPNLLEHVGLAQYFLSHESHLYPLPAQEGAAANIPVSHYSAAQPIGTLLWMLRKVPNLVHKTVAIVGQGQNGLLLTHLVANMCARKVIAIDLIPERLEVAKKMRATHTILGGDFPSVHKQVLDLTDGKGADIVFEMVGHQEETINECLDLVASGGTVLAFGVPRAAQYNINFSDLFRRNIQLVS